MVNKQTTFLIIVVILLAGCTTLVGKATSTITPSPPCMRGDLTGEGALDADDLSRWLSLMDNPEPTVTCCVDLDDNDEVTQADYDIFFNAFVEGKNIGSC